MRGRDKYCITVSGTTNEEMWYEIRDVLGPTPSDTDASVDVLAEDLADYNEWVATNGPIPFDKWLIWKLRIGTIRYGQLPADKKQEGKVGHIWAPCPYSTQSSNVRTRHLLKLGTSDPLPTKVDHTLGGIIYYMKTRGKGPRWGFECTYPGCTHFILHSQNYFYV